MNVNWALEVALPSDKSPVTLVVYLSSRFLAMLDAIEVLLQRLPMMMFHLLIDHVFLTKMVYQGLTSTSLT